MPNERIIATYDDAQEALAQGITPRRLEEVYNGRRVRQFCLEHGLRQQEMTALAARWGLG